MNFINPTNNVNLNLIKALLILFILSGVSYETQAQRFSRYGGRHVRRGPKINIGLEGSMGTRSFHLKSDLAVIDKMSVPMEGGNFGAVIGNKFYRVKIKQGYFNSAPAVAEKFQMAETKGTLNLYLLQSLSKRPKYFEPYFTTGIDRGSVKFYGSYIPKNQNGNTSGSTNTSTSGNNNNNNNTSGNTSSSGTHQCDGPMADPDGTGTGTGTGTNTTPDPTGTTNGDQTLADTDPTKKRFLGKISSMHANVGIGLECHIPGQKHFANLFAEIQYGVPFSSTTKDLPFHNTKVSGLLTVNFGLSFGITR